MKKLAVTAGKIVLWAVGIAALAFGALLAVNSRVFDEAPNPEIAAFVNIEASKLPDAENAYFHVVGLSAPEAEQPHAAGKKWIDQANETQARLLKGEKGEWPKQLPYAQGFPGTLCIPETRSCLAQVREQPEQARKLIAANGRLLARYRAAYDYPGYSESTSPLLFSYPLVNVGDARIAQRLLFMDAALRIEQGELKAVVADLVQDISFGRRMLAGSRTLIGKMLASRLLDRSVLFASDVLATHRGKAGPAAQELLAVLQPLTAAERQLGDAFRIEYRSMKTSVEHTLAFSQLYFGVGDWMEWWYERLLFQPNASFNYLYPAYKAYHEADRVAPGQLATVLPKGLYEGPDFPVWTLFYNPFGKQMSNSVPNYLGYIHRMHDLDALVRLVALQAELAAKGVRDEDVPQYLASADKRYADPWTDKPMQWDAKGRQIYFQPRSAQFKSDKTGGTAGRVGVTL